MANKKPPAPRHEQTAARIKKLEQRLPVTKKVTRHPKIEPWTLPIATALEVAAGIFAVLVLLPWIISLLPNMNVPTPKVPLPDVNLPSINLPSIDLPFKLPKLPGWLETVFYWLGKTLPIWIALGIAVIAVRKDNKKH